MSSPHHGFVEWGLTDENFLFSDRYHYTYTKIEPWWSWLCPSSCQMTIYDAHSLRRLHRNLGTLGAHAMISRADAVLRAISYFVISLSDIEWRRWWMQPCSPWLSLWLSLSPSYEGHRLWICGFDFDVVSRGCGNCSFCICAFIRAAR